MRWAVRANKSVLVAFVPPLFAMVVCACESTAPMHDALPSVRSAPCAPPSTGLDCIVIESMHPRALMDAKVSIKGSVSSPRGTFAMRARVEDGKILEMSVATGWRKYVVPRAAFAGVDGIAPGGFQLSYLRGDEQAIGVLIVAFQFGPPKSRDELACDPPVEDIDDPSFASLAIRFDTQTHEFTRAAYDACGELQTR
jgi:hypothetical protein